jgi:hypothetical protein
MKIIKNSIPSTISIFVLLTLSPISWLLISSYNNLDSFGLSYFSFGFLFNTIIQTVALIFIFKLFQNNFKKLLYFFTALLIVINFRYNIISIIGLSLNIKIVLTLVYLAISILSIFHAKGLRFASLFSALLILFALINIQQESKRNAEAFQSHSLNDIKITSSRNIYFIGLDSLISDEQYSSIYKTPSPWHSLFLDLGFREVTNTITGEITGTRAFYLDLLSMESQSNANLRGIKRIITTQEFLSQPLASYGLLRSNNYKIQFMFHNPYLGNGNNPYFDFSYPTSAEQITLCPFLNPRVGFYLCYPKFVNFIEHQLSRNQTHKNVATNSKDPNIDIMMPILLNRIELISKDSSPWISFTHLWEPGHTAPGYRQNDNTQRIAFQDVYNTRAKEAVKDAAKIIAQIKKYDANPIIIISGDHGPQLSQGWETEPSIRALFTEQERLIDTQRVGMYIYPQDFCQSKIKDGYRTPNLIRDIFQCLSNSKKQTQ